VSDSFPFLQLRGRGGGRVESARSAAKAYRPGFSMRPPPGDPSLTAPRTAAKSGRPRCGAHNGGFFPPHEPPTAGGPWTGWSRCWRPLRDFGLARSPGPVEKRPLEKRCENGRSCHQQRLNAFSPHEVGLGGDRSTVLGLGDTSQKKREIGSRRDADDARGRRGRRIQRGAAVRPLAARQGPFFEARDNVDRGPHLIAFDSVFVPFGFFLPSLGGMDEPSPPGRW